MVTTTLDWVVGGIIALVGLFIMYRALKEPLDLLFGAIGAGIRGLFGMMSGDRGGGVQVIRYG